MTDAAEATCFFCMRPVYSGTYKTTVVFMDYDGYDELIGPEPIVVNYHEWCGRDQPIS